MRKIFSLLFVAVCISGCAATVESRLDSVRTDYMMETPESHDVVNKNNLDLLIAADALFHVDDMTGADAAYEEFNKRNIDTTSGDIGRELATLTLGTNVNDYKPYMMDLLFVSYYQLWAAISDGRWNDARVIINQSYARQTNMSRAYEKLIESNQKSSAENNEIVQTLKDENSKWTAYRDIMNPALMYLSGIYFLSAGDFSDAQTYLSRANGMVPENAFINQDLKLSESRTRPQNTVWIFVEDSFAPKLTERRISLPIISGAGLTTVTVAVSEPNFFDGVTRVDGTVELADIDSMFMTEYSEYRVNDALRAFTSAASRVALQTAMYNSHSSNAPLLGIFSTLYSEFTNSAEVRTWATLPKTIYVARVKNNKSGLIELSSNGNVFETVSVPASGNHLIYLRTVPTGYDIKVIKLK